MSRFPQMEVVVALAIAFVALSAASCSGKDGSEAPRRRARAAQKGGAPAEAPQPVGVDLPKSKGVVLVVIDAMRADGLGCYGYGKSTSPAIDALARESVVFDSFHAESPWTAPSMGTVFTGVPPSIHRCGRAPRRIGEKQQVIALDDSLPTVASLLPDGVKTAAIVNNNFLDPTLGFSKGFDNYDYKMVTKEASRRAAETTDAAIAWLEQNRGAPFFLYIHYFDPHMPYDPPEPYQSQFVPAERPADIELPFTNLIRARTSGYTIDSPEAVYIRGLYDGEVRYTDDQLARLFAKMRELGLFDDTWVFLTADHGEEHFDHGGFEHGHRYEEEVLRVPLVVRAPGGKWRAGARIPFNASHLDLAPTLLELFGVAPPPHFEGRSLTPLMSGQEAAHREAGAEYNLFFDNSFAYTDGTYKLVIDLDRHYAFMYDLAEDPKERRRVRNDHADFSRIFDRATALHIKWREKAKRSIAKTANLSEEARGALEALGYFERTTPGLDDEAKPQVPLSF
jgi:arylsulfatase A-like enzyme